MRRAPVPSMPCFRSSEGVAHAGNKPSTSGKQCCSVDAGKTTLTERLFYSAGVIDKPGSVNAGTTQTDSLALERQRGITIKSTVASFVIDDVSVNLVDTPGHPDWIAEVDRVLDVLDGAVLVVSAVEGVQPQEAGTDASSAPTPHFDRGLREQDRSCRCGLRARNARALGSARAGRRPNGDDASTRYPPGGLLALERGRRLRPDLARRDAGGGRSTRSSPPTWKTKALSGTGHSATASQLRRGVPQCTLSSSAQRSPGRAWSN